ncbi:DUF4465 domain-containing protein [Bacteroidales bacterium OttesenSCG-928-K03]|nr:DUF4465 domain-containing protein [Odoribacter sp. OttesenSCG-928-L07]MDL2238791.1 DUF4465 domain-containing protein [Bacteroidales bacterium OttesenSCG-928-L14]MDL2240792.1 DUF4465 domain-containing protein [Bacteroidales bacterium OttesenSCG-928-K22]MDL2242170.1 DUF4465 domain-containing protein [Bacteroidales bacterium OttesenSCG-928-K03]
MKTFKILFLAIVFLTIKFSLTAQISDKYDIGNSSLTSFATASFDDLILVPESAWYGSETGEQDNVFFSGSFSFTNTYMASWSAWGGFSYSNMTGTNFDPNNWFEHQFRSVVGSGANNSDNFAVVYPYGFQTEINVMHNEEGDIVSGVYVTNAAYTQNSIINGDSYMGDPFTQGDFYKILFIADTRRDTGISRTDARSCVSTTDTIEYYLADYRSTNPNEHYSLTEWQWIDLSALGKVQKIKISVDASRKDSYGLTLPAYLCLDEVGAQRTIDFEKFWNIELQAENNLNLRDILSFEDNVNIDYQILQIDNELFSARIENDELILIANQSTTNQEILISASQKGLSKSIKIYISTVVGIDNLKNDISIIYPVPAKDYLNVNFNASAYQIKIFDFKGKTLIQQECSNVGTIRLENLCSGIYFIEFIVDGKKIAVEKFIKQ